jgi:hypothetical protein
MRPRFAYFAANCVKPLESSRHAYLMSITQLMRRPLPVPLNPRRPIAAGLLAFTLLSASGVRASCPVPAPQVLWSYPSSGARDVPLNIDLWVVSQGLQEFTATLNGEALTMDFHARLAAHMGPPELTANTDYVLRLAYGVSGETPSEESPLIEIAFRTGERRAGEPAAPSVMSHVERMGDSVEQCNDVLYAQGCFDTGQSALLSFEVAGSDVEAWLVETTSPSTLNAAWPAGCGMPTILSHGVPADACFNVQAIGDGGQLSPSVEYCPFLNPQPTPGDAGADASASPPQADSDASYVAGDAGDSDAAPRAEPQSSCSVGARTSDDHLGAVAFVALLSVMLARCRRRARR